MARTKSNGAKDTSGTSGFEANPWILADKPWHVQHSDPALRDADTATRMRAKPKPRSRSAGLLRSKRQLLANPPFNASDTALRGSAFRQTAGKLQVMAGRQDNFRKDDDVRWQRSGATWTTEGCPQGECGSVHQFGNPPYVELPKLCSDLDQGMVKRLAAQQRKLCAFYTTATKHRIFYSRKVGCFLQVLDFEQRVLDGQGKRRPPSEFKELKFANDDHAKLALCCLNSNLFYWFVTVFSDCRHVNKREIDAFPTNLPALSDSSAKRHLVKLATALMEDLKEHSENRTMRFKHDTLMVQCIYPKVSKPILDEIDTVMAGHYGVTVAELDFPPLRAGIVNYDTRLRRGFGGQVKYRFGRSTEEEEE
jgi:hypothetical protein